MKTILIAFDVDGTLVNNEVPKEQGVVANERVRDLLIILAHMKNTKIMVWSGGGEMWARQAVAALGLKKFVDRYADKKYTKCLECTKEMREAGECHHHVFSTTIEPDIAIDDIQTCELGKINLIVREK